VKGTYFGYQLLLTRKNRKEEGVDLAAKGEMVWQGQKRDSERGWLSKKTGIGDEDKAGHQKGGSNRKKIRTAGQLSMTKVYLQGGKGAEQNETEKKNSSLYEGNIIRFECTIGRP